MQQEIQVTVRGLYCKPNTNQYGQDGKERYVNTNDLDVDRTVSDLSKKHVPHGRVDVFFDRLTRGYHVSILKLH